MKVPHRARGFGLVELMVGLALGLLIVGAAISIFLGTRQVSRTTDDLSRLQEGSRFAFELMSRELRESGNTPCGSRWLTFKSLVPNPATKWWSQWTPIVGYGGKTDFPGVAFGTTAGARVEGTGAVELRSTQGSFESLIETQNSSSELKLKSTSTDLKAGDAGLICDHQQGIVFEVTSSGSGLVGTSDLGIHMLKTDAMITRLTASGWYIGQTGRAATGGRALYRVTPASTQEVIDGVWDMQIAYLAPSLGETYQDATAITNWDEVTAARLTLTLQSPQTGTATSAAASNPDSRITRTFTHTVALRNSMP